jgi:hypothetical protein
MRCTFPVDKNRVTGSFQYLLDTKRDMNQDIAQQSAVIEIHSTPARAAVCDITDDLTDST